MMFKLRSKTLVGVEPGKSQTLVMIERENPLKYLSWNLDGDWTNRTDDELPAYLWQPSARRRTRAS